MFKVGDRVSLVDEAGVFKVVGVSGNLVVVLDDHGFEQSIMAHELVHLPDLKILTTDTLADGDRKKNHHSPEKKSKAHKKNQRKQKLEFDLHAGVLIGNTAGMSNHEILTQQLEFAKDAIEKARKTKNNYLVFIHGKGKGKLRSELHKMLAAINKIDFYDADFSKYSLGATEVHII